MVRSGAGRGLRGGCLRARGGDCGRDGAVNAGAAGTAGRLCSAAEIAGRLPAGAMAERRVCTRLVHIFVM
jgi:hypothetical protein